MAGWLMQGAPPRHSGSHRADHLPASLVRAVDAEEIVVAGSLLSQVEGLRDRSLSLLDKAEKAGDLRTALQGIREARACIELLLEVEGELHRGVSVNVQISPQWLGDTRDRAGLATEPS